MVAFLDPSSLLKLYYTEADTEALDQLLVETKVTNIILSEIAKVEFASAMWKKVRQKEIEASHAQDAISVFEDDYHKYEFIGVDKNLLEDAKLLLARYRQQSLKAMDSIQLATAVRAKDVAGLFLTADALLKGIFKSSDLPVAVL